jgi:hypothetical protein
LSLGIPDSGNFPATLDPSRAKRTGSITSGSILLALSAPSLLAICSIPRHPNLSGASK